MLLANGIISTIIETAVSLPVFFSTLIFYGLILLCFLLFLKLFEYYLWKAIVLIYCFFIYMFPAKLINALYYKTNQRIWFSCDDKIYSHLYKIEKKLKQKKEERILWLAKIIRKISFVSFIVLFIFTFISTFDREKEFSKFVRGPLDYYLGLEEKYCMENNIAVRKEKALPVYKSERKQENQPKKSDELASEQYTLNEEGMNGANLREFPGIDDSVPVITSVYGEIVLEGTGEKEVDDRGVEWMKVTTPEGKTGWISSKLVNKIE